MNPYGNFTDAETALFKEALSQSSCYLEWGMGNSTLRALASTAIARAICVEGSHEFLTGWVEQQPEIKQGVRVKRLRVVFSNTGDLGPYSKPDPALTVLGMVYSLPKLRVVPDLALVDGRFRVACALTAALMKVKRVVVHDFESREHYRPMLEFFHVVGMADSMVMLKPKPRLNIKTLIARRAEFFKDPR